MVCFKYLVISSGVNPGHVWKFPFSTALKKVLIEGEKEAA